MLSFDCRPNTFADVLGQDIPKEVLQNLTKKPDVAPRVILLHGPFGCGKTTLARIFFKSLNCSNKSKNNFDVCQSCASCLRNLQSIASYQEYDVSLVGNVEWMREMRDTFYYSSPEWRVIVFDEFHLASNQSQSILLKLFEELQNNLFFILCTTNLESVISTIRSRSLELQLSLLSENELFLLVNQVCIKKNIELSDDIKKLIVKRSFGHARDCLMLIDRFLILNNAEKFMESLAYLKGSMLAYILGSNIDIKEKIECAPAAYLKQDFESLLEDIVYWITGVNQVPKSINMSPVWANLKSSFNNFYLTAIKFRNYVKTNSDFLSILFVLKNIVNKNSLTKSSSLDRFVNS